MASSSALSDWLARLETFAPVEINLGLERVEVMLQRLRVKRPEKILLIAGTNGKGSSVAMSAALLQAAGKSVGAYTSPHVHAYNERMLIDGVAASDATIVAAFERVEAQRGEMELTYFEFGTLAAFVVFEAAEVDVWVLEVGLGGRLDATNAIAPDASLITNIALDHCDWLGDSLDAIASEKAGVMRAQTITVIGDETAPLILDECAKAKNAIVWRAGHHYRAVRSAGGRWQWQAADAEPFDLQSPGLHGDFQVDNAAAVVALLHAAGFGKLLNEALINTVLPNLALPGRVQHARLEERSWVFDVAHNPAAAAALAATLHEDGASRQAGQTVAIVGVLEDKDLEGLLQPLAPLVDRWITVTPESARALPAAKLAQQIANLLNRPALICEQMCDAVEFARRIALENDRILVTGSFFTVGPILRILKIGQTVNDPR